MNLNNIELVVRDFGWDWIPYYTKYENVGFEDGPNGEAQYADEHAFHWLNLRLSYYNNVGTWAEKQASQ